MKKKFGKGKIINHSNKILLVIENDSGRPIVHRLGPKRKSPMKIDADGFKRGDGKSILAHMGWWKIIDISAANIWQIGNDILIPVSLMIPVPDNHFGKYIMDNNNHWGEDLVYVIGVIRNKRGKVIGYKSEKFGRLSKGEASSLTTAGKLDNVIIVKNRKGTVFLRTKRNATTIDNFTA